MYDRICVFLQVEPIAVVVIPRAIGLPEPLLRLAWVQIHQRVIGLGLAPAVLIAGNLVVTVLKVPFDHIN